MKYMHVGIFVGAEMCGINLDRIVFLRSTIKLFSIIQSTNDLDMLTTRDSEITKIWPCAAISTVVHFSIARYIFVMTVFVCFAKRE